MVALGFSAAAPPATAQARATGTAVVRYAERFVGVPYQYGGNGPGAFDCSGFTLFVYRHFGLALPRTSYAQMRMGAPVRGHLRAGDLLFWAGGGHVGIYTGHQAFISATVHRGIAVYPLSVWRQSQSYAGGRRLLRARRPVPVAPTPAGPAADTGGAAPKP